MRYAARQEVRLGDIYSLLSKIIVPTKVLDYNAAMTTMIAEVYDALEAAGAPRDKAEAAAKAVAQYDNDINQLKSDNVLLKWMVGFNLAFTMAILWKVLT